MYSAAGPAGVCGADGNWEVALPDELDFDEFYTAGFRRIVGQIYAMTGNLAEAEDSVQEAFARAWQRWGEVRRYGDPEAWIRTVAYRLSISAWRKAVNRRVAHHRAAASPELPGLSPDHLTLVSALRKISPEQRRAIVLHHLVGLTVAEIAGETGSPEGTVKSHLNRGRKALAPLVSEFAEVGAEAPRRSGTDVVGEW
ncbi:SigE family RNA polymerase sigma factor [Actinospica acidithermotolerans]|uniref:SigE family RNA polymerase sigma factor n=1 Tax=Actinospica acidithermotolerans TaxID=2828514 RepID=UPI0027DC7388|nr:SigE family RNA polymerase sigma factor [Actinospica acidithermotolerans]